MLDPWKSQWASCFDGKMRCESISLLTTNKMKILRLERAGAEADQRENMMGSTLVSRLADRGLARPPRWLASNVQFETIMGSVAYGVSSDTSDMDIYGWVIPPRDEVFPHLRGEIAGIRQAGQAV